MKTARSYACNTVSPYLSPTSARSGPRAGRGRYRAMSVSARTAKMKERTPYFRHAVSVPVAHLHRLTMVFLTIGSRKRRENK